MSLTVKFLNHCARAEWRETSSSYFSLALYLPELHLQSSHSCLPEPCSTRQQMIFAYMSVEYSCPHGLTFRDLLWLME